MIAQKLVILLCLLLSACEQKQATPMPPRGSKPPVAEEKLSRGEQQHWWSEGESVYRRVCAPCHDRGISGAPLIRDEKTWRIRGADNLENLVQRSIEGYQGNQGVMPPRGGDRNLSDEQVEAAVRYMLEQSR